MKLLLWCVLVITVNLVWLVPFFRYLDIKTASETFFQVRGIRELAGILLKAGNLPAVGLILVSATGALRLIRSGRGGTAAAPLAGSLFLFVIAAFGTYIPLFDQMEPGRFLMPALIMISPMAGSGLTALYGFAARRVSNRRALAVAARTAVVTLLILSPVSSLLASRSWYRYTLSTTFTPEVEELVGALMDKTDPSGRVMIEDGPAWNFGESFLPALLPGLTGVQQIGGPYPWAFIRHNFTNFHMCEAMGKGLASMPEEEFWGYMRLYDVRWIVTTTSGCREVVLGILGDDPAWESRHFSLWEIDPRGPSLLDQGVIVTAGYDRIEVTVEGSREGQDPARISLPYHWDRGLRVAEPAVILPEQRMDDPVPFIVLEPHGETSIQIEYRP
jgi:hypothetical protein